MGNSLYPQELQLKLYQALVFSIPILFSIMLFLLFYLFYLKRRASDVSPPQTPNTEASAFPTTKGDLLVVHFDEELRAKDSQCCVCLGEFELKQEVRQVPYCRHVFHSNCIHDWLQKNATCPLCRCHVITPANPAPADEHHVFQIQIDPPDIVR